MTKGRCPGCGFNDASCKKVRSHMMSCPRVEQLFREDPSKVLDPEDEQVRFQAEEGGQEAKDAAKQERLSKRFAELDQAREEQAVRWSPPDILDD